ncbi:class I SAM-dependent methyltransferase [Flavihumibacter rivuli]|uniref:class I SAM-dependent methyltransferase n=1 Tax=Flavihumibacter rivuli TaxID=2838156 RepID=UPI001BDEE559|nr:class I SAM-dependent methyltransferase [Flavihumibacter rivuli]ULQ57989.1 class I SAM-dependent methyltransferase [Flavihumibacter rivuli]
MSVIHYLVCPVCGSDKIRPVLEVKDQTVSGQLFAIWECESCTLRFTQDIPDAKSIGPYYKSDAYVSHTDTRQGLVNQLYHRVRMITLKQKRDLLIRESGLNTGTLLDIGAGTGAFLATMKGAGWRVTGLEPDKDARAIARSKFGLELHSPELLAELPVASFDVITLWHVLEHVHDLKEYVDRIRTLLKDNGRLIIAVPNYTSKDAEIYQEHWAAYDVPRHLYHFSPASMKRLLNNSHLQLMKVLPMWFDSFYISLLSEGYKTGKQKLLNAFMNGLVSNKKALSSKESASSLVYIIRKG